MIQMTAPKGQMQPVKPTKDKRYGLMKVRIGTNHVVRCADGIKRQFEVKDLSRHPKIKTIAVCFHCAKEWKNEAELVAAHPDEEIMQRQQEQHLYGLWNDEPTAPVAEGQKVNLGTVVGLLSDTF